MNEYTTAPLCASPSRNLSVTVQALPAGNSNTKASVCPSVAFSFNPQGDITNGVASTFAWTAAYPAGLTGGAANGTGNVTGTLGNVTGGTLNAVYTVVPTSVTASCAGPSFTITVPVKSRPVGNNSTTAAQCSSVAFSFNPQGNITNGMASTFAWTAAYPAGLTGGAANGTGNVAGTLNNVTGGTLNAVYTVTPTSVSCAGPTFTITVPVRSKPAGNNSTEASLCSGSAFSFNPQSIILPTGWQVPLPGLQLTLPV